MSLLLPLGEIKMNIKIFWHLCHKYKQINTTNRPMEKTTEIPEYHIKYAMEFCVVQI